MEASETSLLVQCFFEFLGTFVMILLGCGVVACTTLKGSKGNGGGWVVITLAWGLAVMCGVFITGPFTGAHLNPAVTVGLAAAGKFSWSLRLRLISSLSSSGLSFAGLVVYLFYRDHFDITEDKGHQARGLRHYFRHKKLEEKFLFRSLSGRFVLILVILFLAESWQQVGGGLGSSELLPVALLVVVIGMALAKLSPATLHQSCPGSRTTSCPPRAPHKCERQQQMGLRMGADRRADSRKLCSPCLSSGYTIS